MVSGRGLAVSRFGCRSDGWEFLVLRLVILGCLVLWAQPSAHHFSCFACASSCHAPYTWCTHRVCTTYTDEDAHTIKHEAYILAY